MTPRTHDVAIVGAGHNALVTAFYLARAGLDVAVFERRDVVRGAIDMRPGQLIDGRAPHESPIAGLFLCGAGSHPAGEVSGAPGYNAAKTILQRQMAVV